MAAGNIFPFLSRKGRIIDDKVHCNGRLGDLLEGDWNRMLRCAERISDMNVRNA